MIKCPGHLRKVVHNTVGRQFWTFGILVKTKDPATVKLGRIGGNQIVDHSTATGDYAAASSSAPSAPRGNVASRTSFPFNNTRSKNHVWSALPRLISCGWFLMKSRMSFSRMRWISYAVFFLKKKT